MRTETIAESAVHGSEPVGAALLLAMLVLVLASLWWVATGRRRIEWNVVFDEPINGESDLVRWQIAKDDVDVEQASLALVEIRNAGVGHLDAADFAVPLSFTFPGRRVLDFTIQGDDDYRSLICGDDMALPPDDRSRLVLPCVPLNRAASFQLLVLLDGLGAQARRSTGLLRRGRVVQGGSRRQALGLGTYALSVLAVGVAVGIGLAHGS